MGEQAVEYGLADEVGYIDDASSYIGRELGVEKVRVVEFSKKKQGLLSLIEGVGATLGYEFGSSLRAGIMKDFDIR